MVGMLVLLTLPLIAASASLATPHDTVRHGVIASPTGTIDVWEDSGPVEFAFARHGDDTVAVVVGTNVAIVRQGLLRQLATYKMKAAAWRPILERYGVTVQQADQAAASGTSVARPPLMDIPAANWESSEYTRVIDFGRDVRALRAAVHYAVPAPGPRLGGLTLAQVALLRIRGPGKGVDSGRIATLVYSSTPSHLGSGDRELVLNAASPRTGWGATYSTSFRNSTDRIVGPRYKARVIDDFQVVVKYGNGYVGVRATWAPTKNQWRAMLAQAFR